MKEEKTFWQDLMASWKVCATCLADPWYFRDLWKAFQHFLQVIWFLFMKVICTVTFPLSGVIVAFVVRAERRRLEARRSEQRRSRKRLA